MVEPKAFQDALLAYHARPGDAEAEAVRAAVLRDERERCARIAEDEARIREEAGNTHVEGSAARDRCFAGARAAANVALGIRGGEVVPAVAQPVLPHPIGTIFSDGYWNKNVMLRSPSEVSRLWGVNGRVNVYAEDQVRELLRTRGVLGTEAPSMLDALQQADAFLALLRGLFLSNAPQLATESDRRRLFEECVRIRTLIAATSGVTAAHHQTEAPADADDPGIGHV